MARLLKKKIILFSGCILSISIGAIIYALFREDTYISKIILKFVDLSKWKHMFNYVDSNFTKYYLPDYLWAFSLSCGICIILNPINKQQLFSCTFSSFLIGTIYELLQASNIITGTGDIIDIALYFLAALTINLILIKEM